MELTAKDICNILRACRESGASKLKFAGIEAEFFPADYMKASESLPEAEISVEQAAVVDEQQLARDEFRAKSERLAMMLIEDPAQYEKLLLDGELADAET
jgi:hypothetical protein